MISKCRDITERINELENQIYNISKVKKPSTDGNQEASNVSSSRRNQYFQKQRPSTAPKDISSTSLRVKVAQDMIQQIQAVINKDKDKFKKWRNKTNTAEETDSPRNTKMRSALSPSKTYSQKPADRMDFHNSNNYKSEDYLKDIYSQRNISPEKEADALKPNEKQMSIVSIKKPPARYKKSFCECMMKNPLHIDNDIVQRKEEVTVMNLMSMNNSVALLSQNSLEVPSCRFDSTIMEKSIDNYLIDSLRGEIEKVRMKLCEIGKRPIEETDDLNTKPSREKSNILEISSGDWNNQSLLHDLRENQKKNEELSRRLEEHKRLQESSMRKAKDATYLLNAYEAKVNKLHEQALRSSEMMAHSKEKFCNILRSRNCQIKNLFELNQQLKKTIVDNSEQMKELKNNYKELKARYNEIEERETGIRKENFKFRETMRKLEKELKAVYKECSKLKQENMAILKELNSVKDDVTDRYNVKLNHHKEYLEKLLVKSKKSEARIIDEVKDMSEKLHHHGNELDDMKMDIKNETWELQTKYKKLLHQYETIVRKFQEYEEFDEIKCNCIEQELKEFSLKMKEKEAIILRERDELRGLVDELSRSIKRNKTTIHELNRTNEHQQAVIDKFNDVIKSKDDQIINYQKELSASRHHCENLEKEMEALKDILHETEKNNCVKQKYNPELSKELEVLRQTLVQERDNSLIKKKIIEDQERTISDLKTQIVDKTREIERTLNTRKTAEETNLLTENLRLMELELNREKQEKRKLIRELEKQMCQQKAAQAKLAMFLQGKEQQLETITSKDINVHKESLSKQVSELECAVKTHCMDEDVMKIEQKHTIERLELNLKKQKQDWEMQRKILMKDKEKALHAARFASQKLLDTVNDFQKQMCQQKAAQAKLAMLLQGKEQQLETITSKVKSLLAPHDPPDKIPTASNYSHSEGVSDNFCQIKEIYSGPDRMYQSKESVDERESKSFRVGESNSCATYRRDYLNT